MLRGLSAALCPLFLEKALDQKSLIFISIAGRQGQDPGFSCQSGLRIDDSRIHICSVHDLLNILLKDRRILEEVILHENMLIGRIISGEHSVMKDSVRQINDHLTVLIKEVLFSVFALQL